MSSLQFFLGIALSLWEDEYRENNETPGFPEGTYYYFITNEFPGVSRLFIGTPSDDFKLGTG